MSINILVAARHKPQRQRVAIVSTMATLFAYPVSAASQLNTILINIQGTIQIVLRIVITLAIVVFIWGIVKLIGSAGNPQKIKEAKSIIVLGIVSLAVIASLAGLIEFLQTYFGITGGQPVKVPQF